MALLQIGNKVLVDRERGFTDIARELTQREFEYRLNKEAMRKFMYGYDSWKEAKESPTVRRLALDALTSPIAVEEQILRAAEAAGDLVQHTGTIQTGTDVAVGGGVAISSKDQLVGFLFAAGTGLSAHAGANLELSRHNMERLRYNLLYSSLYKAYYDALKASTINGQIDKEAFVENYWSNMHKFYEELRAIAQGKDPFQFGASSIIGEPLAAFIRAWNNNKGIKDINKRVEAALQEMWKYLEDEGYKFGQAIANNRTDIISKMFNVDEKSAQYLIDKMRKGESLDMIDSYRILHNQVPESEVESNKK